jgi:S1-C subfamily serine protease
MRRFLRHNPFDRLAMCLAACTFVWLANCGFAQEAAAPVARVPVAAAADDWLVSAAAAARKATVTVRHMATTAEQSPSQKVELEAKEPAAVAPKGSLSRARRVEHGAASPATKPVTQATTTPSGSAGAHVTSSNYGCVSVCSGVSLGDRTIVTAVRPQANSRVKITLPGGEQAAAEPAVIDHYSGLVLLRTDRTDLPKLELAEESLQVGQKILSAAAWGVEKPVVSHGIVSATERWLEGTNLPPLVQCDLRITQSSAGAPILNSSGKLAGLVVAADVGNESAGWCYALPVEHVRRLMRVRKADKVVVLERRRPVVGAEFDQGNKFGTVQIRRVVEGGPGHAAGLRARDQVVEVEGVKVRTVYDVVRQILIRQPGDEFKMTVRREQQDKKQVDASCVVTLGGGDVIEPVAGGGAFNAPVVDPKVVLNNKDNTIQIQESFHRGVGQRRQLEGHARYEQIEQQQRVAERELDELKAELRRRDERIESLESRLKELQEIEVELKALKAQQSKK